ncbi:unnamed protein product [Camellia sinensis]
MVNIAICWGGRDINLEGFPEWLVGILLTQLFKVRLLGPRYKKEISCEFLNPDVDGLSLTGLEKGLVEVRGSWSGHPNPKGKRNIF